MNVTFKSAQIIGNRPFKIGTQVVPDYLSGNSKFKALVKAGTITILPRDVAAQKIQGSKDALNAKKAEVARKMGKILAAARLAQGVKPADITEIAKPGTTAKIASKPAIKPMVAKL